MRLRHRSLLVLVPAFSLLIGCSGDSGGVDDQPGASSGGSSSQGGGSGKGGSSGGGGAAGKGGSSGGGSGGLSGAGGKAGGSGQAGSSGASGKAGGSGGSSGSGGGSGSTTGGSGGSGGSTAGGSGGAPLGSCSKDADCMPLATVPPGCAEAVCDTQTKKCVYHAKDADKDTFPTGNCKALDGTTPVILGEDCDDTNPDVSPKGWDGPAGEGHPNHCGDGLDQNCSGIDDDGKLNDGTTCTCSPGDTRDCSLDASGKPIKFPKLVDGKPVGICAFGHQTCVDSGKWGPCVDAIAPAEAEACDLNSKIDENCDGLIDDDDPTVIGKKSWICDADNDNYVDPVNGKKVVACKPAQAECSGGVWVDEKLASQDVDCDDTTSLAHPGAKEQCNGKDDNCNGAIDEDVTYSDYWWDNDHDGVPGSKVPPEKNVCKPPPCPADGDCAKGQWLSFNLGQVPPLLEECDSDPNASPKNSETCDGLDNDCNGMVDDGNPGGGGPCETALPGACKAGLFVCSGGSVVCKQLVEPGTQGEICDGLDNDCDGAVDNGVTFYDYWWDDDHDGVAGGAFTVKNACKPPVCPAGGNCNVGQWVPFAVGQGPSQPDSCDNDPARKPGNAEICDGVDNNCNGTVDEGNPGGQLACNTGKAGICAAGTTACSNGVVVCVQTNQPAAETCNGADDNCNGSVDEVVWGCSNIEGCGGLQSCFAACNAPHKCPSAEWPFNGVRCQYGNTSYPSWDQLSGGDNIYKLSWNLPPGTPGYGFVTIKATLNQTGNGCWTGGELTNRLDCFDSGGNKIGQNSIYSSYFVDKAVHTFGCPAGTASVAIYKTVGGSSFLGCTRSAALTYQVDAECKYFY